MLLRVLFRKAYKIGEEGIMTAFVPVNLEGWFYCNGCA